MFGSGFVKRWCSDVGEFRQKFSKVELIESNWSPVVVTLRTLIEVKSEESINH